MTGIVACQREPGFDEFGRWDVQLKRLFEPRTNETDPYQHQVDTYCHQTVKND